MHRSGSRPKTAAIVTDLGAVCFYLPYRESTPSKRDSRRLQSISGCQCIVCVWATTSFPIAEVRADALSVWFSAPTGAWAHPAYSHPYSIEYDQRFKIYR